MTIVRDRVVLTLSLCDLIQRLRDEVGTDAVAAHEGECAFEEIDPAESWKLIQHHQQLAMLAIARFRVRHLG